MSVASKPEPASRLLAAFDFDLTIVSVVVDFEIIKLLPPHIKVPRGKKSIVEFMSEVFEVLHEQNIPPELIRNTIQSIPPVEGQLALIKHLKQTHGMDIIIVSDSNSFFIDEWLKLHQMHEFILKVFSNPAVFKPNGCLQIKPYDDQIECLLSSKNMCKGNVLMDFVAERRRQNIVYEAILFIADGPNDICPALRLKQQDIVAARKGFQLEGLLCQHANKFKAELILWNNGIDLREQLESKLAAYSTVCDPAI